jgi:hypothetical protein
VAGVIHKPRPRQLSAQVSFFCASGRVIAIASGRGNPGSEPQCSPGSATPRLVVAMVDCGSTEGSLHVPDHRACPVLCRAGPGDT